MNPTLAVNVLIIAAVIVCMVVLQNPLALLALLVLQPPPQAHPMFMPGFGGQEEAGEDEETPMGFTADVR